MVTYTAPKDLRFTPLGDVEPGSVVRIVERSTVPYAIRLASDPNAEKVPVLVVGGDYSFIVSLFDRTKATQVVSPASNVRLGLSANDPSGDYSHAGTLTVHDSGAFITSKRVDSAYDGAKIDLATWGALDSRLYPTTFSVYTTWELGMLDHRGEFVSLFNR